MICLKGDKRATWRRVNHNGGGQMPAQKVKSSLRKYLFSELCAVQCVEKLYTEIICICVCIGSICIFVLRGTKGAAGEDGKIVFTKDRRHHLR